MLVVVGDVSGKGLKAAMAVSAIMGALQAYPSRRPTDVLAHLNRVVYGQVSGFVTCCVALIATDGAITIANAGNPAPYHSAEMCRTNKSERTGCPDANMRTFIAERISAGLCV